MKLRSLAVNQFKRFTEPTRLGEFGDNVNLVVGPNELGKSTLLDALRSVLFERHRSGAAAIRTLQNNRSGAAPVVELVFEIDGAAYTLTKRFIKSPYAQLTCPDGTLLEADAAEAKLRELLGFAESGTRGATAETLGMWGVLWVQQGQSFGRPDLPASALASLSAALESEVGAVLGGRRGTELPQIIDQRRGELITTARRQPRGEYKEVLDQIGELQQLLSEQQRQQLEMSSTLEQLTAAETRLARLDDGNQDQADRAELTRVRDQLGEVERRELRLRAAHSELQNRQGQLERARRAQSERAALRREIAVDQERLDEAHGQLRDLREQEQQSSAPLQEMRQALRQAEATVETTEQAEAKWRDALTAISLAAELDELLRQQSRVAAAQQRLEEIQRQAKQIQVTDASLRQIRQAADAYEAAKAQRRVTATRITFDIPSDRLAGIEAAGAPLTDPTTTIEALEPITIVIPGRGRILIDPVVADSIQLLQAERVARTTLRDALGRAGAESLADAEVLRDQRRDLEAAAIATQRELEQLGSSDDASALQDRIDELRHRQTSLPHPWPTAKLPERDHAETAMRGAQSELQNARAEERVARVAAEERGRAVAECSARVREAQTAVDLHTEIVHRRQERLRGDVETAPDDDLATATHAGAQAVAEPQQIVSALARDDSTGIRPQLEARITRLESAIAQRADSRVESRTEIARLRERIELQDSAGIDEAVEHTQHELEQATRHCARSQREIEVLDLLSEALHAAESQARERYLAPVLNRIQPYLRLLFPNAEIRMDEHLNIIGMSRGAGGYEERFDHLSMGTQEQIAVLVRLAFAEMLVDQGAPAAVILDDALVFSDDQRMQLMFDILSHAAQRVQIVIFTCREQLFEGLGADQLQLTTADSESLRSA